MCITRIPDMFKALIRMCLSLVWFHCRQYCNPSNCRITYSPSNILLQLAKYVNPKHWRHYSRIGTGHWRAAWSTWKVCYCCYGGMIPALLLLLRRYDTGCVTAVTGVWYRLCCCCYWGMTPVVLLLLLGMTPVVLLLLRVCDTGFVPQCSGVTLCRGPW